MKPIVGLSLVALALSACSNPKDANNKNFEKTLNAHFEKTPVCLPIPQGTIEPSGAPGVDFPRYVSLSPSGDAMGQTVRTKQMFDALVEAGLLEASDTTIAVERGFWSRQPEQQPVRAYRLTKTGEEAVSTSQQRLLGTAQVFCYGTPKVTEILRFTEPADMMGMKVSNVSYRFKIDNLAPWAKSKAMIAAYPVLDPEALKSADATNSLILTSDGWVHEKDLKL